jgi:hypothetical protein
MIRQSYNKPYISIPRHSKTPIDTYTFNRIYSKKYYVPSFNKDGESPLVHKIRNFVTKETGHDPYDESQDREGLFVTSRQLFLYFIRKYVKNYNGTKYSQKTTGNLVGKDHATVAYAEKCVDKFYKQEKEYRDIYNKIDDSIKNILN